VVAAVALVAAACIPQGTWTATTPATIGVSPAYAADFSAISCPTTTFCMAVGQAGEGPTFTQDWTQPVVQTWDGTAWTDISASFNSLKGPDGADFGNVSCASATSCLVDFNYWSFGDTNPRIYGWNGSTWTSAAMDIQGGHHISCASGSTCYAAAEGGPLVTWDGTSFHTSDTVTAGEWAAIDCVTGTACYAYGFDGLTAFNATTATVIPGSFLTFSVRSMDCPRTDWCVAVGTDFSTPQPTPMGAVWNGTTWTTAAVPSTEGASFESVSCANGAECIAVGRTTDTSAPQSFSPVQAVYNGFGWTAVSDPPGGNSYTGVSCAPGTTVGCIGVGGRRGDVTSTLSASRFTWPPP